MRTVIVNCEDVTVGLEDGQLSRPGTDNSWFGFDIGNGDEAFLGHAGPQINWY